MKKYNNSYFSNCYVIFENSENLWWLKFLKKGFRHCYIICYMAEEKAWLELNPYSNQFILTKYSSISEFQNYIEEMKKKEEVKVISMEILSAPKKCAPLGFFTCVEFVKRVIGLHSFFIITPYQLFKKLKVVGKKS